MERLPESKDWWFTSATKQLRLLGSEALTLLDIYSKPTVLSSLGRLIELPALTTTWLSKRTNQARRLGSQSLSPLSVNVDELVDIVEANRRSSNKAIETLEKKGMVYITADELLSRLGAGEPIEDQVLAFQWACSMLPSEVTINHVWLDSDQINQLKPYMKEPIVRQTDRLK